MHDNTSSFLKERCPEMEQVQRSGDYLNTYPREDPYAVQIAMDALFHPAHCPLVLPPGAASVLVRKGD
ncbi:MIND kinetochore complex component Mtw1 [Aspergillus luchuensis]|uniref:MIND kinetochore complex component Mtw1 n=2 Tax=Aspergillus kawachii TaxID=1069201 RepID=A0A146FAS4_ASPKA|nr:MIND kinetochore complex component Mtw1 [Aspergillus luchuensis]